jgi:hypothetical protein
MNIVQKLDQLAEYQYQSDALNAAYEERRMLLIPPEIRSQLDELHVEHLGQSTAVQENIAKLTAEVKAEVVALGGTVKGARLQAVYAKGRVSWDTSKLDIYAKAYPEIAELRKEGEPSVSIRAVK